jgi:hypothetical protein
VSLLQRYRRAQTDRGDGARTVQWWVILLVSLLLLWHIAPQQIPVLLSKVNQVAVFAVMGYLLDIAIFPFARPHLAEAIEDRRKMEYRRAILMAAVIVGGTVGV